jgi:hypothetical protein
MLRGTAKMKRIGFALAVVGLVGMAVPALATAATIGEARVKPECRQAELAAPHWDYKSNWVFPTPGLAHPQGILMGINVAYPLIPTQECADLYRRVAIGQAWVATPAHDEPGREVFLARYLAKLNWKVGKKTSPIGVYLHSESTGFLYQENYDNGVAVKKVCAAVPSRVHMSLKWSTIVKSKATGKTVAERSGTLPVPLSGPHHCR